MARDARGSGGCRCGRRRREERKKRDVSGGEMRGLSGRRWSPGGAAGRLSRIGSAEAWRAPDARQGDPLLLFPARHGLASRSLVSADPTRRRGTRGASRHLGLLARGEHVIRLLERALVRFSGAFRLSRVTSRREDADLTSGERAVAARANWHTRKGESARRDVGRGKAPPEKSAFWRPVSTPMRRDVLARCGGWTASWRPRGLEDEPSKGSTRVRA